MTPSPRATNASRRTTTQATATPDKPELPTLGDDGAELREIFAGRCLPASELRSALRKTYRCDATQLRHWLADALNRRLVVEVKIGASGLVLERGDASYRTFRHAQHGAFVSNTTDTLRLLPVDHEETGYQRHKPCDALVTTKDGDHIVQLAQQVIDDEAERKRLEVQRYHDQRAQTRAAEREAVEAAAGAFALVPELAQVKVRAGFQNDYIITCDHAALGGIGHAHHRTRPRHAPPHHPETEPGCP